MDLNICNLEVNQNEAMKIRMPRAFGLSSILIYLSLLRSVNCVFCSILLNSNQTNQNWMHGRCWIFTFACVHNSIELKAYIIMKYEQNLFTHREWVSPWHIHSYWIASKCIWAYTESVCLPTWLAHGLFCVDVYCSLIFIEARICDRV